MASNGAPWAVDEPFPIFTLAHKYLLYDVNVITYIRQKYNICGVLIGGLPQAPQQNVFLGVPLELMPEEARVLVEKGVAYVAEDVKVHKQLFMGSGLSPDERRAFQDALRKQGVAAAKDAGKRTDDRKKVALQNKLGVDSWNDIPEDMLKPTAGRSKKKGARREPQPASKTATEEDESLFASPMNSFPASQEASRRPSEAENAAPKPFAITPTTSQPPLSPAPPPLTEALPMPSVPKSYPLFKNLHEQGYFMTPGLRFGCQYTAYPGDPLRFHSHFLADGMDWDQEFDLLDIVGGGRLGTGVKKGFLIGGEEKYSKKPSDSDMSASTGFRTFCIEWGGM